MILRALGVFLVGTLISAMHGFMIGFTVAGLEMGTRYDWSQETNQIVGISIVAVSAALGYGIVIYEVYFD